MSNAITLSVSLPVKVVVGTSWGSMLEYEEYQKREERLHLPQQPEVAKQEEFVEELMDVV
jgi:hypothetical protein